ncbi:MAG: bifunctional 4-hydroxy-2-oxoglutarate aldolase/2-dehydro-3-deoxy-phosphogluconate aldolase, partial [Deltaproteobacteria bacterium]|nr:bifunctional 4-hydroxy-2-oxoglutarate aldolase/2-dehydro-3-deoxy-phosphogluconate aldolase [Deltaproteobacteria bacterium]
LFNVSKLEEIKKNKVIAVIRAETPDKALEFGEGCIKGGLKLIEVTFSFPGAQTVIAELSKIEGVLVGAGTVLDAVMAVKALESGASFLVSPHTDQDIIDVAMPKRVPPIQGALTSSEIVNAWKLGVDMVKVFPVSAVGGPPYIKAIKEAIPFAEIMTTGGVNYDNFLDYIKAGASAVGLSSAFLTEDKMIKFDTVMQNTKLIVERLSTLKEG